MPFLAYLLDCSHAAKESQIDGQFSLTLSSKVASRAISMLYIYCYINYDFFCCMKMGNRIHPYPWSRTGVIDFSEVEQAEGRPVMNRTLCAKLQRLLLSLDESFITLILVVLQQDDHSTTELTYGYNKQVTIEAFLFYFQNYCLCVIQKQLDTSRD